MPLYERLTFIPAAEYSGPVVSSQMQRILSSDGIKKCDVTFSGPNGKRLHGWFFKKAPLGKVMLVSHGKDGNMSDRLILTQALLSCGTSVFLYDYEGYGESEGSPTVQRICQDGLAAYDYLVGQEKIPSKDIIAYGESIGTGVTCYLSTQRPVSGLILQTAFPSLIYAAHDHLWYTWLYPDSWFPDLNNLAVLKEPHPPVLIIHGKDDRFLPPRYSQFLFDRACEPKQLKLIDKLEHYKIRADDQQFAEAIKQFMSALKSTKLESGT
jgi:pimeloyl-ACP methyl ester carboxylesterase